MLVTFLAAAAMVIPPQPIDAASWVSADDYPPEATQLALEGVVEYRLKIDSVGHVIACTVESSSGVASLDTATCELMSRRGHFLPARDKQGNAVEGVYTQKLRWQIPQEGPIHSVTLRSPAGHVGLECAIDGNDDLIVAPELCASLAYVVGRRGAAVPITIRIGVPDKLAIHR